MRLIQSLASKELVKNLPKLKFDQHFCDACKIRKQAYASHKAKNIVSTTRCLGLLHMDLFGLSAVRSYGGNRYTLVIVDDYSRKVKDSLNVKFDETPPPSKTSPLVDDDLDEEEAIKVTKKRNLENFIEDETLEIDEIVNIKKSKNHPLENIIGYLNQRTLRSQEQNQSIFFCFISTIEPKNELVLQPKNMTIIGTKWVFRNKLNENDIVSRNKASVKESKLMKTPMSSDTKLMKDEECESVDSTKYRGMIGQVHRILHEEEIDVLKYQILTREIVPTLKPLEEIIQENVFCLGPYVLYDRVMSPLAAQQEQKTRRDHGTRRGRHSTSFSSAFDQPSSSHLNDDDDDGNGEGTSRASTPSLIR
nr:retrovirus-related Pol polyprotein from transposon TNT 1-94 [Tanacetum cinerariifolium]